VCFGDVVSEHRIKTQLKFEKQNIGILVIIVIIVRFINYHSIIMDSTKCSSCLERHFFFDMVISYFYMVWDVGVQSIRSGLFIES